MESLIFWRQLVLAREYLSKKSEEILTCNFRDNTVQCWIFRDRRFLEGLYFRGGTLLKNLIQVFQTGTSRASF